MRARWAIGIDLGGTQLRAGRVGPGGALEDFRATGSRTAEGPEAPLEAIAALVKELRAGSRQRPVGVGIGVPGAIDPVSGSQVGRTAHLPHWEDFPLRRRLERRLGLPVAVDNDANLAALAERRCGAARGARLSLTVTVGTGVGCGIVAGGRLLRGARGGAGEIGHLALGRDPLPCDCGVEGCVEPEMSGSGLGRRAERLGLGARDAAAVFAAAARGDAAAARLVEETGDRLGAAIATAVNLLNPDVVVIGGGVAQAGEALLEPVRRALVRYALESHRRELRVVAAALGPRAGVVGAGLLAWASFRASARRRPAARGQR